MNDKFCGLQFTGNEGRKVLSEFTGDERVAEAIQKIYADGIANACEGEWIRILGQIKSEIGDDAFRNWVRPMALERVDAGHATHAAPTRLLRDWVAAHYLGRNL